MLDFIPKRHVFSLIGLSATTLAISVQVNISLAIVYMVKRNTNFTLSQLSSNSSNLNDHNIPSYVTKTSGEFDWSPQTEGLLVGCQFIGTTIGIFIGGRLGEVYGAKFTLVTCLLTSSILTLLTPLAARWSIYALLASRLLVGFGAGPVVPVLIVLMSRWIPLTELNFTASIVLAGYGTGAFLSFLIAGALCANPAFGWPSVFYLGGMGGVLFCLWCCLTLKDSPQMHQSISPEELDYISKNLGAAKQKVTSVPWKSILTSVPFWALAIGTFGQLWIQSYYMTTVSVYVGEVLQMESAQNGLLSSLPNIIRVFPACAVGVFIDYFLVRKIHVSKGLIRKGATLANSACVCLGFAGILLSGTNTAWNTAFIIIGALCSDFIMFGVLLAPIDMAPNLEGTLSGILTGLGNTAFTVLPTLVGYFTRNNNSALEWRNVYYCSIAIVVLSTLLYLVFGSSNPQPWATAGTEVTSEAARKEKAEESKKETHCKETELVPVDCEIVSAYF